jgi:apolipoprotein N-acyltransferase
VRAVNTGISAVINGDGEVVDPEVFLDVDGHRQLKSMRDPETGRWHKSLNAVVVHDVPLDNRASLYLLWGDWFAGTCLAFAVAVFTGGWYLRRRDRRNAGRELFEATLRQPA